MYSRRGDITKRGLITPTEAGWLCGTGCLLVRPSARVDPLWLSFWLSQPKIHRWLLNQSVGATMANLNTDILSRLPVLLPPRPEQERIARVLGAFDDLIDTNLRLAISEERLAQVLASQVPEQVPLDQLATFPKLKQRRPLGTVDHFSIPAFDAGRLSLRESGDRILSGKHTLTEPSVLVSRLNPSTARTWMAYPGEREAVCSPEFVVAMGAADVDAEEVWAVASTDDFWSQMQGSASGTTNSRQRVDKAAVPRIMVPDVRMLAPSARVAITALVQGAGQGRTEAAELVSQRDELLPLLMSGDLRVSSLEGVA
ncbi:restriction endonuclease subunit S [Ornithinimicrobium sediminis]|uniref:restriction endonuclease subunit S n=1 Tax=Ornithinimicrobium sediminis TaxID=2904603 RepID=UPI001E31BF0C|nr:restriction endonuclease subunit S [Ornithinimicrobium sediminis]